jgi:hypothetical protein
MFVLFFVLAALAFADVPLPGNVVGRRAIIEQVILGQSNTEADVLDVNLTTCEWQVDLKSSVLYNACTIDKLNARSFNEFKSEYGLDFLGQGIVNCDGYELVNPPCQAFPYKSGSDDGHEGIYPYRFVYDSCNPEVAKNLKWINIGYGWIVEMFASGTFTSGNAAGQKFNAGDLLFSADYDYVKGNDESKWNKPGFRETVQLSSYGTTLEPTNSIGLVEQYIKAKVVDDRGNVGYGVITVTFTTSSRYSNNGTLVQVTNGDYTWGTTSITGNQTYTCKPIVSTD